MTVTIPTAPPPAHRAPPRLRANPVVRTAPDPGELSEVWVQAVRNRTEKAQAPEDSQRADTVQLANLWAQTTARKKGYAEGPQSPGTSQPEAAQRLSTAAKLQVRDQAATGRANARSMAAHTYRARSAAGMAQADTAPTILNRIA